MSVPMVLLPVFVLVGLTFVLLFATGRSRGQVLSGGVKPADIATQADVAAVLFYVLIALAMPLRHADLVIVMLSWIFVVTRFAHAGILATSSDGQTRSLAWLAGALVVLAMWVYFALRILFLI